MLTYYPKLEIYVVSSSSGHRAIDKASQVYEFCDFLRSSCGFDEAIDLDGTIIYETKLSDRRANQIYTFVDLERTFRQLMGKGD